MFDNLKCIICNHLNDIIFLTKTMQVAEEPIEKPIKKDTICFCIPIKWDIDNLLIHQFRRNKFHSDCHILTSHITVILFINQIAEV